MSGKELILPKFDVLSAHAASTAQLTHSLKSLGIDMFSHTRVYKDNSFIDISDRADILDYFYYKTDLYKHYFSDVDPWAFRGGFFLCS